MAKIGEHLLVLNRYGEALLARLHLAKKYRAPFLADKAVQAATKKWPAIDASSISQSAKNAEIKLNAATIAAHAEAMASVREFTAKAVEVIIDAGAGIQEFDLSLNPSMTCGWLDLIVRVCKANALLSKITDRKAIVACHAAASQADVSVIAAYINDYEQPFLRLTRDVSPIAMPLFLALSALAEPFFRATNTEQLRNEGAISLTVKPAKMNLPFLGHMGQSLRISRSLMDWVAYGFLLTPDSLYTDAPLMMLKTVLQQSHIFPLYGDIGINLVTEYNNMEMNYKGPQKHSKEEKRKRKALTETLEQPAAMRRRRMDHLLFVKQELRHLYHVFKDSPGLIAPNIETAIGGLVVAAQEVQWYFLEQKYPATGGKKGEGVVRHPAAVELLRWATAVRSLVLQYHASVVVPYYSEYLKQLDAPQLHELISAVHNAPDVDASVCKLFDELSQQTAAGGADLRAVRINCHRAEAYLSSPNAATGNLKGMSGLLKRCSRVLRHATYVDDLVPTIDNAASLSFLYFFRESLSQELAHSIANPSVCADACKGVLAAVNEFSSVALFYPPSITEVAGPHTTATAEECINVMVKQFLASFDVIAPRFVSRALAVLPPSATASSGLISPRGGQASGGGESMPGSESSPAARAKMQEAHGHTVILAQLGGILCAVSSTPFFDKVYSPITTIRETLSRKLKKFILDASQQESSTIQRPTVFKSKVDAYIDALNSLRTHLNIDMDAIVEEAVLEHVRCPAMHTGDALAWVTSDAAGSDTQFISAYAEFFGTFFERRMPLGVAVWAPSRMCFVGLAAFNSAEFMSYDELAALCSVCGVDGVRLIDKKVLGAVKGWVSEMRDSLSENSDALDDLKTSYKNEEECTSAILAISGLESFMSTAINIGNALLFRKLLYRALGESMEVQTPLVRDVIGCIGTQMKPHPRLVDSCKEGLALFMEGGFDVCYADAVLRAAIAPDVNGDDEGAFAYLPFMLAAGFRSRVWAEATYKSTYLGYENGVHVLSEAFNALLHMTNAKNPTATNAVQHFVEVGAIILLRIAKQPPKARVLPYSGLCSAFSVLDQFIESSPVVSRDTLEQLVPYTLLRSFYHDLYDEQQA